MTSKPSRSSAVTDIPLIVVSISGDEWDKVAMLDAGADDYLTKPYGIEELLARIRVALRRSSQGPPRSPRRSTTTDFTIDVADRRWMRSGGTEIPPHPHQGAWSRLAARAAPAAALTDKAETVLACTCGDPSPSTKRSTSGST